MEKEPKIPTPEEMAKIQKERTLNDAELLKGGAQYKVDENGKYRLDPTAEQIKGAKQEMEESLGGEKMEEKRFLSSMERIGELVKNGNSQGIEEEFQKTKKVVKEYFIKWHKGKKFALGLSGDTRAKQIEQDQEYADSEYLNPVINFIKDWIAGKVMPVVYGDGGRCIEASFEEWFGGEEKRKEFMSTLQDKVKSAEKNDLFNVRKACQEGANYANREKYAAMSDEDIEKRAKEITEKNTPSESKINDRIIRNVVRGRTGECSSFTIHDENGGSHYECGCVVGILKRAGSIESLNQDLNSYNPKSKERVIQYFRSVYKDKYDRLKK